MRYWKTRKPQGDYHAINDSRPVSTRLESFILGLLCGVSAVLILGCSGTDSGGSGTETRVLAGLADVPTTIETQGAGECTGAYCGTPGNSGSSGYGSVLIGNTDLGDEY